MLVLVLVTLAVTHECRERAIAAAGALSIYTAPIYPYNSKVPIKLILQAQSPRRLMTSGYGGFDEHGVLASRYTLRRHLGAGSSSDVMEAYDSKARSVVAIKKISGVIQPKRVLREIHIMKRLKHDNIIRLVDVRCMDLKSKSVSIFLILEYLDTDLRKLIASPQYLTKEHIQSILSQILHGLMYMHR